MKVIPQEYISEIRKYRGISMPIISINNDIIACIARCIVDVLTKHKVINFSPNWFDIGEIGKIRVTSRNFFVIYLSDSRAGEFSLNQKHKEDIAMIFYHKYDSDIAPILFQGLSMYDLIKLCQSLKSKTDPFYNLCKNNITFWKMKAIEFGIDSKRLPDNNDTLALKKIIQLIKDRVNEYMTSINEDKYTIDDYIDILKRYPSPEIEDLILQKMCNDPMRYINIAKIAPFLTEHGKMLLLDYDPNWIKYVENPSREIQLAAVNLDGRSLQYIKNPLYDVQLAAIKNDGYAIQHIQDPSEEIQLEVVKQLSEGAIQYINNPTEKIQLEAVKKNGNAIRFIKDPSEKVQLVAIKQNKNAIKYIKNPTEKAQLEAVKKNGNAINSIDNPSENIQLAAVKKSWRAIQYIKNPSEKVQLEAIKQDEDAIQYIKNPTENVQLESVKKDGNAIRFIKDPSEKIQLAAVKQDGSAIQFIQNPSKKIKREAAKHTK